MSSNSKSSDITLYQSAGNLLSAKPVELPSMNYLVVLDDGSQFVATKLDDGFVNYARCVGFFTNAKINKIQTKYRDMVKQTAKEEMMEVSFPWTKIKFIQSLSYKYRGK